ncbi:MAG TPA: ABC transporter ATP-binding protein [Anaerolineaceae bacterium]|nr:ABC transporter ATP-binding protein [Chloroflexota bacterium]HNZ02080.1 ABC transporter ATP-binding protein [Anaerolineaceae bacterium]HOH21220.1 ABC transporter ATP-binding protein [Anaerolineaceae bacterium]HQF46734.1 ABC transporter ATP-binding protein [Anaerolineaceae bacterium]HQL38518.1 ABC transporter ATP-binding protein [Anaerolineaceae bacterium]
MNSRFPPEISNHQPLIRLRQVVKVYRTAAGDFPALKGLDLDVEAGEFLAITGKSGAGKTTLVNMITGTDALTSGVVEVGGVNIHQLDENRRALWRGRHLGVIYQSFHLLPNLTLLDNILLPMDFCGLYRRRASRERAMDLLRQMEMADHAHKLPSQISGGQQQRVAIARALANDPPLIVADEPTGRLDSVTAEVIFRIFQQLVAQGKTLVMVTHDRTIAGRVSRMLTIQDGEVLNQPAA